jgi:aldehyde dehydrogenase (NAD+)
LIDANAGDAMARALEQARADGGVVHGGGRVLTDKFPNAH